MKILMIILLCCINAIRAVEEVHCRFTGNDIRSVKVPNFQACYELCNSDENCNAFTMMPSKSCYTHNFRDVDHPPIVVQLSNPNFCGIIPRSSRPSIEKNLNLNF